MRRIFLKFTLFVFTLSLFVLPVNVIAANANSDKIHTFVYVQNLSPENEVAETQFQTALSKKEESIKFNIIKVQVSVKYYLAILLF